MKEGPAGRGGRGGSSESEQEAASSQTREGTERVHRVGGEWNKGRVRGSVRGTMRAGCPAVSGSDKAFYVVDTIKFKIVIAHSRKIAFKSLGVDRPAGQVILTSRNSVLRLKQWQGNKKETV